MLCHFVNPSGKEACQQREEKHYNETHSADCNNYTHAGAVTDGLRHVTCGDSCMVAS